MGSPFNLYLDIVLIRIIKNQKQAKPQGYGPLAYLSNIVALL
jgi:hypothetical protein